GGGVAGGGRQVRRVEGALQREGGRGDDVRGAEEGRDPRGHGRAGLGVGHPGVGNVPQLGEVVLLQGGQEERRPAPARGRVRGPVRVRARRQVTRRQRLVDVVVVVTGEPDLFQVVLAPGTAGGLAHLLHGWQEQADEYGDDGDDDEQLDQGEAPALTAHERPPG